MKRSFFMFILLLANIGLAKEKESTRKPDAIGNCGQEAAAAGISEVISSAIADGKKIIGLTFSAQTVLEKKTRKGVETHSVTVWISNSSKSEPIAFQGKVTSKDSGGDAAHCINTKAIAFDSEFEFPNPK